MDWYGTWADEDRFKMYLHLYFPTDRDRPDWVILVDILKESYQNPSSLAAGEIWEDACSYINFNTITFVVDCTRIPLYNADPALWTARYSCEQAMFMYYDLATGDIGVWTPYDLVLDQEVKKIAHLLKKQPEEVLAVFSNWLQKGAPLYFNYVDIDSYDWINEPRYNIEYVY
jgi:G3E family GTPase